MTATPEPTDLTPEEVQRALMRLPGWSGDERRLRRTVRLPPGTDAEVRERIAQAERELNHHAQTEEGPDGIVLTLWTHTRDRVTDLDVQLATRIHEIVEGSAQPEASPGAEVGMSPGEGSTFEPEEDPEP